MKNIENLLTNFEGIKHTGLFGKLIIKGEFLSGVGIYELLEHIKWKESQPSFGILDIEIQCKKFQSTDVINVLEIIMYYLAKQHQNLATIEFTKHNHLITTNLYYQNSILPDFNKKRLGKHYASVFDSVLISKTHYRKQFLNNNNKKDASSIAMTDISIFLENVQFKLDDSFIDNFSEIVGEIVANSMEHSNGDCLIDVKCVKSAVGNFVSLNIISLTDIFIGNKLVELLKTNELKKYPGAKIVEKSYKYHSKFFDTRYDESSFGFVCSFQNGVSTRENNLVTGGTGLTTMVKNIHGYSISNQYLSYIISGNNTLFLNNEYIAVSKTGNIGFNKNNNFFRGIPDRSVLAKEPNTFPGTIFSINLIIGD